MFIPTFVFLKFFEVLAPPPFQNPAYATDCDLKKLFHVVFLIISFLFLFQFQSKSARNVHLDLKILRLVQVSTGYLVMRYCGFTILETKNAALFLHLQIAERKITRHSNGRTTRFSLYWPSPRNETRVNKKQSSQF